VSALATSFGTLYFPIEAYQPDAAGHLTLALVAPLDLARAAAQGLVARAMARAVVQVVQATTPTELLKAVKNEVELDGMRYDAKVARPVVAQA
jgi:Xaa-Pro aminopeptidase